MAECRLPFSFNILSRLPSQKRKGPPEPDPPPRKNRRVGDSNVSVQRNSQRNGQLHYPGQAIGHQAAPRDIQSYGDGSFTPRRTGQTHQPPQNPSSNPAPVGINEPPDHTTSTDRERAPTLTEVNPDSWSTTGGARIWLKGIDFPALFPLFARFGNAVVPTVSTCF